MAPSSVPFTGLDTSAYIDILELPFIVIDKDRKIKYVNKRAVAEIERGVSEILNHFYYDCVPVQGIGDHNCPILEAFTKKQTVKVPLFVRGQNFWYIKHIITPIIDAAGGIQGAVIVQDTNKLDGATGQMGEVVEKVEKLFDEVIQSSNRIGSMGDQMVTEAEKIAANMQQIQGASSNISEGSQSLADTAGKMTQTMDNLSLLMSELSKKSQSMNNAVVESNKLGVKAGESSSKALTTLSEIKVSSEGVFKVIQEVQSSMKNVASLTNDISEISEQVNMLALNAAIEAARAGEAGRGFAVVADAVKQLAGQTRSAAKTANQTISDVNKSSDQAIKIAAKSGEAANRGNEVVSEAIQSTKQIVDAMGEITGQTEVLVRDINQSVEALRKVNDSIMQVASFSQESASSTQETYASIEEQAASLDEFNLGAKQVLEESRKLREISGKAKEHLNELKNSFLSKV